MILRILVFAGIFVAGTAWAQANYYNADVPPAPAAAPEPTSRTVTVTSVEKCYAQLPAEDVIDIKTNFVKPYEECQKRLMRKLKADRTLKAGEVKAPVPPTAPANPAVPAVDSPAAPAVETGAGGGFFRVQKSAPKAKKPNSTSDKKQPVPAAN